MRVAFASLLRRKLCFEIGDTGAQWRHKLFHLDSSVAWSDVLRAVPIVRQHVDEEETLDDALVGQFGESGDEVRMLAGIFDLRMAKYFQALAIGIIHQEECDSIARRKIASGKHLAVSTVIGKSQLRGTQHTQESGRSSPMLNVWPSVLGDCRHVERISRSDETLLFLCK